MMQIRNKATKLALNKLLIFSILIFATTIARAQFTPGQTAYGTNNYIEYIPGDIPIIISVPHGGYLTPTSIPDRSCTGCVTGIDGKTQEVAYELDSALRNVFGGIPHIIINKLGRIKLDANREIVEAAQGDPAAEIAWHEFHGFIQTAKNKCKADFGSALYIDLHSHGHTKQRIELGYLITRTELQNTDATLDNFNFQDSSAIKHLKNVLNPSASFSQLLRGSECMGEFLHNQGYPSVPSASDPAPLSTDAFFSGGYNVARHGSRDSSNIDGIQFELNYTGIRSNTANRNTFARATACALRSYMDKWYLDLDSWDPGNIVTTNLDDGLGSLRSVLLGVSSGDTITFDPAIFGDTIHLENELQICSDVTIMGPTAPSISISGGDSCRIMYITRGHHVEISNLNFVNGNATSGEDGGALNVFGSIHLKNCLLTNNYASDDGGAIAIAELGATAVLDSCKLIQNTCGDDGGAFRCFEGQLTLNATTVKNNSSPSYGGALSNSGIVTIFNSTFSHNQAAEHGGALRNFGTGILNLTNTTISENTCGIRGAGISSSSSATVSLEFCTVTDNDAGSLGGGVRITGGGICNIHNTLIAENTGSSSTDISSFGATFTSQGFNLIGDTTGSALVTMNGDQLGNSTSPLNAAIDSLNNNGGITETIALLPTSACVNMADSNNLILSDQRGLRRPSGNRADIGAFELCQTTTMTDTQSECNSFTWLDGVTYLSDTTGAIFTITNVNGCDSTITLDLTLEQIDTSTTVIARTITANAPNATYQWLDCDTGFSPISGATNQSYTATSNGNYAVVVSQNGCSDTSSCSFISTVSINTIQTKNLISIYPNPTSGRVIVRFTENQEDIQIRLINNLGQEIMNQSFGGNKMISFDISAPPGVYTLEVSSSATSLFVSKLIKY